MEKLSFTVDEFEGPLDLILQLIARHQMDIHDIEISSLLEQYLACIRDMREQDLDVASEFLEMASRLVYIKTVSLLPRQEDGEDPRRELVGQLLEYQACKQAAALLGLRNQGFDSFVRVAEEVEHDPTYAGRLPAGALAAAYRDAMGKGRRRLPPSASEFSPLVTVKIITVASRILHILRALYRRPQMGLEPLLESSHSRSELVATFLAVLELLKGGRIRMEDDDRVIAFVGRGPRAAQD